MLTVILPTTDIINHYRHHESTFSFLEGGMMELVRRLVLSSSGWYYDFFIDFQKSEESVSVCKEIIELYEGSMHRRYIENTHPQLDVSGLVESIINEVEIEINAMMNAYFLHVPYRVHKSIGWLGMELVIYMSPIRGSHDFYETPVHRHLF